MASQAEAGTPDVVSHGILSFILTPHKEVEVQPSYSDSTRDLGSQHSLLAGLSSPSTGLFIVEISLTPA